MAADFLTFEEVADLHSVMSTIHGQLVLDQQPLGPGERLEVDDEHGNTLGYVCVSDRIESADGSVGTDAVFVPTGWPAG
jgi:hypothetical protein